MVNIKANKSCALKSIKEIDCFSIVNLSVDRQENVSIDNLQTGAVAFPSSI